MLFHPNQHQPLQCLQPTHPLRRRASQLDYEADASHAQMVDVVISSLFLAASKWYSYFYTHNPRSIHDLAFAITKDFTNVLYMHFFISLAISIVWVTSLVSSLYCLMLGLGLFVQALVTPPLQKNDNIAPRICE